MDKRVEEFLDKVHDVIVEAGAYSIGEYMEDLIIQVNDKLPEDLKGYIAFDIIRKGPISKGLLYFKGPSTKYADILALEFGATIIEFGGEYTVIEVDPVDIPKWMEKLRSTHSLSPEAYRKLVIGETGKDGRLIHKVVLKKQVSKTDRFEPGRHIIAEEARLKASTVLIPTIKDKVVRDLSLLVARVI